MVVKAQVDKLDALPDALREHYKKVEADGKTFFQLDVESVAGLELVNPQGMLSTIEKLRQFQSRAEAYGDVTPTEAKANLKKIADLTKELEDAKAAAKGKGGGDAEERVKQVTEELNRIHKEELGKVTATAEARLKVVHKLLREDAAGNALGEAGFKTSRRIMLPHLVGELDVVEDESQADPEKRFRTVVRSKDGAGERVFVEKATGHSRPMTVAERAKEMATDPELKRYVDVETKDDGKGGTKQPPKRSIFGQPAGGEDNEHPMSATEMLVRARGG